MKYAFNPNCDGIYCNTTNGEVRLLPLGGDGNLILCKSCVEYEIEWRKNENKRANREFDIPNWDNLEVYKG